MDPLFVTMSPIVAEGVKTAIKKAYSRTSKDREAGSGDVVIQPLPAEMRVEGGTPTVTVSGEAISQKVTEELADVRQAQLTLYARTQYGFYAAFQSLVVVLAVAAVIALVVCIVRLMTGDHNLIDVVVDVSIGVGAVVTGGAAKFIQAQASDAKDRYLEALKLLED